MENQGNVLEEISVGKIYIFRISMAALTTWRAEIPNMSIKTVGGPERGTVGTNKCLTMMLRCRATADKTASPKPPSLKNVLTLETCRKFINFSTN